MTVRVASTARPSIITGRGPGPGRGRGAGGSRPRAPRSCSADVLDDEGEAAAEAIGDAARFVHLDVTDEDDVAGRRRRDRGGLRPGHVLVNNAGILGLQRRSTRTTPTEFRAGARHQPHRRVPRHQARSCPSMQQGRRRGDRQHLVEQRHGGHCRSLAAYTASKWAHPGPHDGRPPSSSAARASGSTRCTPAASTTPMTRSAGGDDDDGDLGTSACRSRGSAPSTTSPASCCSSPRDEAAYVTGAEFVVDGGNLAGDVTPRCPPTAATELAVGCGRHGQDRPPVRARSASPWRAEAVALAGASSILSGQ